MLHRQSYHSCKEADLGHKLGPFSWSFQIFVCWSYGQNENAVLPTTLALLQILVL